MTVASTGLSILLALLGSSAFAQEGKKIVNPGSPLSGLPFSPGVLTDDWLYLSGALGIDEEGNFPEGIEAQTRLVLAHLKKVLAEAGLGFDDVVVSDVFLVDSRYFKAFNAVYREFFGERPPTRATVEAGMVLPGALVEIAMLASRRHVKKTSVTPQGWRAPTSPYSWAIQAGETLVISGMVSRDPRSGQLVGGDTAKQTKQVLTNIGEVLKAAGMSFDNVVRSKVFLTDARDFSSMNEVYRSFFGKAPPARATVQSRLMNPALTVEIQCVAVKDPSRRVVIAPGESPPSSPFSPSIVAGGRQFLSGMVGRDREGYPADVSTQTRLTMQRLIATLKAAGHSVDDVTECVVYLTDVRDYQAMNAVYREMMPKAPPVRATVGTPLMSPRALVEIMMTAEGK